MVERSYVLIVDAERICLTIAESMVKNLGFSVITACDGVRAVEKYRLNREQIVCVLMDIQMPEMNGIEAFDLIKKQEKNVKVIFASGHLDSSNRKEIEQLQPAGILTKPFSFEELSGLLNEVLDESNSILNGRFHQH